MDTGVLATVSSVSRHVSAYSMQSVGLHLVTLNYLSAYTWSIRANCRLTLLQVNQY